MYNEKVRKIIFVLIRIGISTSILVFLLKKVDVHKIIETLSYADKPILLFAFLSFLLIHVIVFLRWKMLLNGLGFNLATALIFRSFCIGLFSNLFFPSTVGGDFIRSIDLGLRTQKPGRVVASVILDRLSGYSALVVVALLALTLGYKVITDKAVFISLGIISTLLVGILAILFNNFLFSKAKIFLRFFGRTGQALSNLHYEIYNFRNQKRIIIKSFNYSFIIQLCMCLFVYLISLALGVRISPIYFFILVPIISVISAIPVSIAGLGLREASSMYFFTKVGMPGEVAVAISLLCFLILFSFGVIGGIIYVLTFSNRRIQCN